MTKCWNDCLIPCLCIFSFLYLCVTRSVAVVLWFLPSVGSREALAARDEQPQPILCTAGLCLQGSIGGRLLQLNPALSDKMLRCSASSSPDLGRPIAPPIFPSRAGHSCLFMSACMHFHVPVLVSGCWCAFSPICSDTCLLAVCLCIDALTN